ncbi:MAG TPA: cellulase family glycosylhydrolase [Chthoniobacter sp.]|nr:cellulase family glycosylhydrolase [Chthoniobacter sp.]
MLRPLVAALLLLTVARAAEPHPSLPPPVIPDCLGVNIHFTDPKPGELEMLAAAGFKWVRMDFGWGGTERKKGEYDFSAFDRLVAALDKFKIRAVFILDYGNPLYADPGDQSPFTSRANTPEFREAFGRWAVAAVQHFKGRGYLWEMWNEPNGGFWKSPDKTGDYIALAKSTGEALRQAGLLGPKGEAFIGPATSTIDLPYLEACFKAGLLDYWDAVSVHPYRQTAPETVEEEYRNVRLLIRKYAPKDKVIPIISGEWGYSSAWTSLGKDETARAELQGKYLPRQFLTNIANDVALSIWYDWHDDGTDPKEGEHRFGIVSNEYHAGRDPVYDPKPAYKAMKVLSQQFGGYRFNKQLILEEKGVWEEETPNALIFMEGDLLKVALWTAAPHPNSTEEIHLPASAGEFAIVSVSDGSPMRTAQAAHGELVLKTAGLGLVVLQPEKPNDFLRVAAASPRLPLDFVYRWPTEPQLSIPPAAQPAGLTNEGGSSSTGSADGEHGLSGGVKNPLNHEIRGNFVSFMPIPITIAAGELYDWNADVEDYSREAKRTHTEPFQIEIDGQHFSLQQATTLICLNPITIEAFPPTAKFVPVRISNPGGDPFLGVVRAVIESRVHDSDPLLIPLRMAKGERAKIIQVPYSAKSKIGRLRITVHQDFETEHQKILNQPMCEVEIPGFGPPLPLKASDIHVSVDGDAAVLHSHEIQDDVPSVGVPLAQSAAVRLKYSFGKGWKFMRLSRSDTKIAATDRGVDIPPLWPTGFGCWLHGDGKGCQARIRFTDATGQTFQPDGPKIDWMGWRYITFPMESNGGKELAHWGGANDGEIHYPIKWDTLFLLDNVSRQPIEGEIYLSAPTLIY